MNFNDLLKTMTPAQIIALINISESDIHAGFQAEGIYEALERRGLVMDYMEWIRELQRRGDDTAPDPITSYGHAFLAWYRAPRDVPQQEVLL